MSERGRVVIYQLLVRLFGNTCGLNRPHGSLEENGCGRFSHLNDAALSSLRELGCNHLWLTGVPEHASGSSHPGRPADPPDLLKGRAGSPYALRDVFDVCPDLADDPARRIEEFRELVERCHRHGLRVLVDFVPNHVARSHDSDQRPEHSFGREDERTVFFARDNHFYYLGPDDPGGGPPLRLPTAHLPGCDGSFPPEEVHGRVTGNNAITWSPSLHDWYETVKLNYGHDFTRGRETGHLPAADAAPEKVPRTWRTMDEVLAHWQALGVDGFRVDMAHLVPIEFWAWLLRRARARQPGLFVFGEAYDNDPAKLTERHVLDALLEAGFDAVYDDPAYDLMEELCEGAGKWANDLDAIAFAGPRVERSLRYAENHDEVRIANPHCWGGHGARIGRPACAVLFLIAPGPLMIYHGQEVGEPAAEPLGFGGGGGRTSIFDYGSMPELVKWVNGHRYDGGGLDREARELRAWYGRLLRLSHHPAFARGRFYGLNHANLDHPGFGRLEGEHHSGRWLHAFLRHDPEGGEAFLVIANFHPGHTFHAATLRIPESARAFIGRDGDASWRCHEVLGPGDGSPDPAHDFDCDPATLDGPGLPLPELPPLGVRVFRLDR